LKSQLRRIPALVTILGLIVAILLGTGAGITSQREQTKPPDLAKTFPALASELAPRSRFTPSTRQVAHQTIVGFSPSVQASPNKVASGWTPLGDPSFKIFYPASYADPTVVEAHGIRAVLQPIGAQASAGREENGHLFYPNVFPQTDSWQVFDGQRSEEFLLLRRPGAPKTYRFQLRVSPATTKVSLVHGAVRLTNRSGAGLTIPPPVTSTARGDAKVRASWQLGAKGKDGGRTLVLSTDPGKAEYPIVVDPGWSTTGSMTTARASHTATLLPSGKVLVAGGQNGSGYSSSAESYDPSSGTWSATGTMATARYGHTATLLPNGKVLVAGGEGSSGYLASAELYDPSSGTWSETGSMTMARDGHTATLLPSGKVLVAAGYNGGPMSSAELYDPSSGTWSATGSMTTARDGHTATLLPNGQVLVAGGYGSGGALSSAELYGPSSGTWSATGSMTTARDGHTATLLLNGKVLVAGGTNGSGAFASAELYDPASGTWSATGSLATARFGHTATLLPNGQVLVAGGYGSGGALSSAELYDPSSGTWSATGNMTTARGNHSATLLPNGQVLVAGGFNGSSGPLANAEEYDPSSGTWSATGIMTTARADHTATLLPNGKVLVAGGQNGNGVYLSSAELYDPASGTWGATGSLVTARYGHTATLLPNGKVLVAGGGSGSGFLSSAEVYDPSSGTWSGTGSMLTGRQFHTATLLPNGKVLVAGGYGTIGPLASAELYDPSSGIWSATGTMTTGRYRHTATLLPNGKVLVAGGWNNGALSSAELYDPSSGTWSATGSMTTARGGHKAILLPNGKVLVAGGGSGSGFLSSAELYDPSSGTWSATGTMTTARYGHTAMLLPSGKVLVAGGYNDNGVYLSSAELYDPSSGIWSLTGSMTTARSGHTATLLPNGEVLVAAGFGTIGPPLASAEVYDPGLGFADSARPGLNSSSTPFTLTTSLSVSGSGFQPSFEASGGNGAQNSPTNYPLVQLRSLVNEQTVFLGSSSWNGSSFTSVPSTGVPPGYALTTVFVNGIPSVSQPLLVTGAGSVAAASAARTTFGDSSVTLGATVTSATGAIVNEGGVTFTVLQGTTTIGSPTTALVGNGTASVSYPIPSGTQGGSYTIQVAYSGWTDFNPSNGTLTNGLTINPASQTVSFGSLPNHTYGDAPFSVSASASSGLPIAFSASLANVCSVTGAQVSILGAGTCTVTASQAGNNDYQSASTPQSFTIATAPLTATANNASRVFGAPDPTFSVTYNGFVNSDGPSSLGGTLLCVSTASTTSPVGTYAINCSGQTSPNYAITDKPGSLTVTPAGTTTSASNASALTKATSVTLSAQVLANSPATAPVNEGSVTFTLKQGTATIGSPTSGTVSNGSASVSYALPSGLASGTYAILAVYSGGNDLTGSIDSSKTLTLRPNAWVVYLPHIELDKALLNGGFESGLVDWATGGALTVSVNSNPTNVHSGSQSALLGNPAYNSNCSNGGIPVGVAYVSQQVTVPNTPTPTLTFWYRLYTQDWTGPDPTHPAYDSFGVFINGQDSAHAVFYDGNPDPTKATQCNGPILDLGWKQGSVSLATYRGTTITLYFTTTNEGSTFWNTYTYLADVAISP